MHSLQETVKIWWQAIRFHFTPCSFLPALLGGILAVNAGFPLQFGTFLLMMIALIANHIALNMTDDYFDYLHGADLHLVGEKNPYAGGSGVLVSGAMTPETMKKAFLSLYGLAALIGLYLVITHGWFILALGVFGVFSSYFYTAPPIRYSYRGLGELAMLINLGPVITIGAYYLQAQTVDFQTFLNSLPLGLFVFAQILFNEIPDEQTDGNAGKRTLVVRFGKKGGLWIAAGALFIAYGLIFLLPLVGMAPISIILTFLSAPFALKAFFLLSRTLNDPIPSGNAEMVKAHIYTGFFLVLSYGIDGLISALNVGGVLAILGVLVVLMVPIILKLHTRLLPQS